MVRWQETVLKTCYRVLDARGGRVEVTFSFRKPNKIVPIVHSYPDNQVVCEEIELEEE